MADDVGNLIDRIRTLPDRSLVQMLRVQRDQYTPEAISIAEEVAEERGGLPQLSARFSADDGGSDQRGSRTTSFIDRVFSRLLGRRPSERYPGLSYVSMALRVLAFAMGALTIGGTITHLSDIRNSCREGTKVLTDRTQKRRDNKKGSSEEPVLLSGGNPQIAKGDGDAPVQAYIEAMPEWKSDIGRRLDALIERTVPDVRKAVRWNSPLYGIEGQGWFVSYHCFTKYVKVTFFRGTSLRPLPPVGSKSPETRYVHIYEDDLDEAQMADWIKQAAAIPGWDGGSPRLYGGVPL